MNEIRNNEKIIKEYRKSILILLGREPTIEEITTFYDIYITKEIKQKEEFLNKIIKDIEYNEKELNKIKKNIEKINKILNE